MYKLNTLDKNIISEIWRHGGECTIADIAAKVPDLSESSLLLYVNKLADKAGYFYMVDLPRGEKPKMDTRLQMDTEYYAWWVA
jgi:hypothetical protein